MTGVTFRLILAPLCGAAMCLLVMPRVDAARNSPIVDQFVGRALSASGTESAGRVDIYIERWSTPTELESIGRMLQQENPLAALLPAIESRHQRAGVVLMAGIQAHGARSRTRIPKNLAFAREIDTPDGRRVIVISDEHIGIGEKPLDAYKDVSELNVLEIRFDREGHGIGKIASAADVAYNPTTRVIEVKNYGALPALLIDVRAEHP